MIVIKSFRVRLLVGSNGKASACIESDAGWGDLADNIMDGGSDPDATARYVLTVDLPLPTVEQMTPKVREV